MSNDFDTTARSRAAAHAFDLAGIAARNGELDVAAEIARRGANIINGIAAHPLYSYTEALLTARIDAEGINASVAAVYEGKHPAVSLMGLITRMRDDAHLLTSETTERAEGRIEAYDKVLDTLEGEGRNATTARST